MRLKPNQTAHGLRSAETCNPSSSGISAEIGEFLAKQISLQYNSNHE